MKKMVMATLAVAVTGQVVATEAPTVYGIVSKEMRYIDQDVKTRYTATNISDIANAESRLGVKGTVDAVEGLTVGYNLELGLNSSATNTDTHTGTTVNYESGLMRFRQANVSLAHAFGTLTVGQAWTATANAFGVFDPLASTGASLLGADQAADIASAASQVGYASRTRKDLVKFQTPTVAGLTYTTSYDRNDDQRNSVSAVTVWENLLSYAGTFGDLGLKVNAVYNKGMGVGRPYDAEMGAGVEVGFAGLKLAGTYTTSEAQSGLPKNDVTQMMGALSYTMGANVLALTYGAKEVQTTTKSEYTQIALGYTRNVSKNFLAHATLSQYEVDTATDNKAMVAATGLTVKF